MDSLRFVRDRLVILLQGNPAHHRDAISRAHALARAFVHAEAYLSFPNGIVLEVEPLTWLEAQNTQSNRIIGLAARNIAVGVSP